MKPEMILFDYGQTLINEETFDPLKGNQALLERKLKHLIPDFSFEFIITSSDYVFRKPHPRMFEMALHKAQLPAEKVWFCGDNLLCDIQGAYDAGMKPVWYPVCIDEDYRVQTDVPYEEIGDWLELIEMIQKC